MNAERKRLLVRAQTGVRESALLEFKSSFDPQSLEATCEVIKDIVAFANSGGGVIVFGADDRGTSSGADAKPILEYDLADLVNRIAKYTGYQFADVEIVSLERSGVTHAAFLIGESDVPIVFAKPGTYDVGGGKQKTAFAQGTVYFRHGAKSEPGNRDDLLKWRDRAVARVRREWMSGIRKVVEAPEGHIVTVTPAEHVAHPGPDISARISTDPKAPSFVPRNAEQIWPYRQKELLRILNQRLKPSRRITSHDIFCIKRALDILASRPDFAYKPHKLASPQYSEAFADWIVEQATKNDRFFEQCRAIVKSEEVSPDAGLGARN